MAEETAIQLVIEKLDSWLAKERCILWGDFEEKLESWLAEERCIRRNDFLTKLHSLMHDRKAKLWKDNMKKKAKEYERCIIKKADLGSLEEDKEKLYSFLVIVSGPLINMESPALEENVCSLMLDVADLWEFDDEGNIYKNKLHSLLVQMAKSLLNYSQDRSLGSAKTTRIVADYSNNVYSLIVEMAGVWKDSKGKLSKEKLNSWLANKADLEDYNKLLRLLQKFTDPDLHLRQICSHIDIRQNVEKVRNQLKQMVDIITDIELRLEEGSKGLHYFISDALEMAHHAHLLLQAKDSDPFILLLQIFNCFNQHLQNIDYNLNPLNQLSKNIASIQTCIQETKERMLKFRVKRQMNAGEELVDPTHSDVVRLDKEVELLLGIKQTIICIRGIPGIGKTTLVKQLYNHEAMVDQYMSRAWVNLSSRELTLKEILINLLRQLQFFERDDHMLLEKKDITILREMLSQQLQQSKRVFIVLDHVSEDAYFNYVLDILPKAEGNRLLFTSRSRILNCSPFEIYDHMMKYLDDEKSWQLLSKTVFSSGISNEEFPKQLKEKVRLILRKCGGLPLAIKEVGRQWAEKRRFGSEWEEIVEESSIHLDLSSILEALESTYHNLYPDLKQCFLYLGLFKEGATIKGKKMAHVWTAGRVVIANLEEFSNDSLLRLSDQSIIEVKRHKTQMFKVKTFRTNAVFQRLSIKMVEDKIDLDILRIDENNRSSREPRHRVVHCSREKINFINNSSTNQSEDEHLISLFFHGGGYFDDTPSYWNNFQQLKILDMEGFGLKILPKTVGELSKLRYLGLRNNYILELPHLLGRLKKLEVLDIVENFMVEVDADTICKMASLCHLYMSEITCRKPLKMDSQKNLKTLTYISVDNWAYEVSRLKMMTSLNKLGIEELDENSNVSKLFASLSELKGLKCLILRGFRFRRMPSLDDISLLQNLEELKLEGCLTRLPSANTFPSKLEILSLVDSCLDEDPMPILEKLPKLKYLKLQNAYTGQQMVISSNGFLYLAYLVIGELWHLRNLQIKKGAMPILYELEIYSCPYQENPLDIQVRNYWPKIVTTKNIASKIRADLRLEDYKEVDIQP